jgi:hypothetical protein
MVAVRCYGCSSPLTPDNDSEAHIIPKALVGRLAPKGLICRKCNTALDAAADHALVEAFGAWPTLLAIPREGVNPPKTIVTRHGEKVRVEEDGSMTRFNVVYNVTPTSKGDAVHIAAGNLKTIRQLLGRAAKDYPAFDPVLAEEYAKTVGMPLDDLKLSLDFSPQVVFGGIVSATWLFLIKQTGHPLMDWQRLLSCIKAVQTNGGTFRYFINGLPGLKGPQIDIGHTLVVRAVPSTGELITYVEILGVLKIGGLFAESPKSGYEMQHIYAYDVIQKRDRTAEFSIDPEEFDQQNWRTVGLGVENPAMLQAHFQEMLDVFVRHYQQRFSSPQ